MKRTLNTSTLHGSLFRALGVSVFTTIIAALLIAFAWSLAATAEAGVVSGHPAQAALTPTAAQGTVLAPSPVSTGEPPADSPTSQAQPTLPVPEETRQALAALQTRNALAPAPTATLDTSKLPSDDPAKALTPATSTGNTPGSSPAATASSNSFPWLPLVLLGAALLAGLVFLLSRRRPAAATVTTERTIQSGSTPAPYNPGATSAGATTVQSTTSTTSVAGGAGTAGTPAVVASAAAAPPAPFVPPGGGNPSSLDCPNCGTSNAINENFCHECGQDLRPVRSALLGTALPGQVAIDTLPYLETSSRVDEQLEYVLSRPTVRIGTAAGSDIVVDSLFNGWQSVDPQHAELRREQDGFVIVDLGSQSGTFVNEMRTGENLLSDGDVIRVGDVQFIFRVPA
ncbi:MAG TPA: FHA domain-containing protein [Chloroflexia bacterium]|nr:FHA domain-containing protein [Chloroflexia bacterium]